MAGIKRFEELLAWQKSHNFVLEVYKITNDFPKIEEFGLKSQLRRAVVSIPSNVVEGFKRKGLNDSCHFYNISQGSLEECKYQLRLARDLGYINNAKYDNIIILADEVGKLLHGWIKIQK